MINKGMKRSTMGQIRESLAGVLGHTVDFRQVDAIAEIMEGSNRLNQIGDFCWVNVQGELEYGQVRDVSIGSSLEIRDGRPSKFETTLTVTVVP